VNSHDRHAEVETGRPKTPIALAGVTVVARSIAGSCSITATSHSLSDAHAVDLLHRDILPQDRIISELASLMNRRVVELLKDHTGAWVAHLDCWNRESIGHDAVQAQRQMTVMDCARCG